MSAAIDILRDRLEIMDRVDRNKVAGSLEIKGLDDPQLADHVPVPLLNQLRFEVLASQTELEYGLPVRFEQSQFTSARWASGDKQAVDTFVNANKQHIAHDHDGAIVYTDVPPMGHRPDRTGPPRRDTDRHQRDDGVSPGTTTPCWGAVSTVKARLNRSGTSRPTTWIWARNQISIYLDAPTLGLVAGLQHPKITLIACDAAYWANKPAKAQGTHQRRQTLNATQSYRRSKLDWVAHLDVDEFLWPPLPPADMLAGLAPHVHAARIRPNEVFAGDGTAYKRFIPNGPERAAIVAALYPTFGAYLKGGFLNHVADKLWSRAHKDGGCHLQDPQRVLPGPNEPGRDRAAGYGPPHNHAEIWDAWRARFSCRRAKGAYRADIPAATAPENGGMSLHALFHALIEDGIEVALRSLYDEVCADTPDLRHRLATRGLLRLCDLNLDAKIAKHFP